jgi:hypothetical protein
MNGRAIPGACALVEGKRLNHFKNIPQKREVQSILDRFFYFSFSKETEASY